MGGAGLLNTKPESYYSSGLVLHATILANTVETNLLYTAFSLMTLPLTPISMLFRTIPVDFCSLIPWQQIDPTLDRGAGGRYFFRCF